MKAAGIVLSICVILASIPYFMIFHISTFQTWPIERRFEIEPPEGYAYWVRKEFWDDVGAFSLYSAILIALVVTPIIGVALLFRKPSRKLARIFIATSIALSVIPLWMMIEATDGGNFTFLWLLQLVIFCGCIYGAAAAGNAAVSHQIGTQQGADGQSTTASRSKAATQIQP